jgi:hypothetical protein
MTGIIKDSNHDGIPDFIQDTVGNAIDKVGDAIGGHHSVTGTKVVPPATSRVYINSARQNPPFGGWTEVQGGGTTDTALAAAAFGDRLYIVSRGLDNRVYINSARQNQPFDGWTEVQGGGTTDTALAAGAFSDRLYVVSRGLDNRVYINSALQNQPFGGWTEVQGGGTTDTVLAAAAFGDRLYIVAKGMG